MLHQPLASAATAAVSTTAAHITPCGRGAGAATVERDWGDGPAFRANISQLEAKTSTLKQSVKRILKTATACLQAQQVLLQADQQFTAALRETPCTEPLFTHYLNSAWDDIHNERERLQNSMQTLLIGPLQKLYDCDIKQAEHKRRQFEEESKKYYASLSKYLGGKKNETKYLAKKSRYDMIRFDYHAFLTDLHRGKKETELLYHLFSLQERQHAYYTTTAQNLERQKTGLEHIAGLIADASREQAIVNKERSSTRKALQAAVDQVATQKKQQRQHSGDGLSASAASSPSSIKDKDKEGKFHGIRDLQSPGNRASAGRRKEGVLFATSRPLKVNGSDRPAHGVTWHKYWCILRTGQLCEYSNWKRSPAAHREPLNLRFATVRVARNTDRKFCFEVITPQFRRLYQAMSKEDMNDWVSTINNAIESVLNGAGSTADINYQDNTAPRRNSIGGAFVGHITSEAKRKFYRHSIGPVKRASSGFMDMNFAELLPGSLYLPTTFSNKESESTTDSSLPSIPSLATSAAAFPPLAPPMADDGTKASTTTTTITTTHAKKEGTIPRLLQRLYEADVSNTKCADCGSENPEWCSLNLGILLCIECSGIHRSLGSHLSKVRSLMLDSTSYTPEVIDILLALGNARSNAIWDPRISTTSSDNSSHIPTSNSPRSDKVDYIFAKYRERTYVRPFARPAKNKNLDNPQMLLLEAIEKDDLVLAGHSIALGADPNVPHTASTLSLITNKDNSSGDYEGNSDDNSNHEPKYISLPVLDADGEQVPDKFLTFPVPEPFAVRYPLHFSLLKRQQENKNKQLPDFVMAEFLFQNGADAFIVDPYNGYPLSELVGIGHAVDDSALMYFNQKITARGARRVWRSSMNSPPCKKA
ncbi:hypothetical protein BDB00DRAFT_801139 [Zychaea mexicana]|uniref:uncharacterized protein n=1 Tax=Zychaea mexicana TaxID=64656 RepID=UPI0022FED0F6|nr:uncharacterized protein BDB00DRAFT_801139 [Zychaea mexicana]KAI9498100.1 hypothetical protein BDB00DRAFT_801139 [Zychaea mexicana]